MLFYCIADVCTWYEWFIIIMRMRQTGAYSICASTLVFNAPRFCSRQAVNRPVFAVEHMTRPSAATLSSLPLVCQMDASRPSMARVWVSAAHKQSVESSALRDVHRLARPLMVGCHPSQSRTLAFKCCSRNKMQRIIWMIGLSEQVFYSTHGPHYM